MVGDGTDDTLVFCFALRGVMVLHGREMKDRWGERGNEEYR